MPGTPSTPAAISFGPKRVEQRHEQTFIEKFIVIALVLTLLLAAGVFGYRYYLQTKLTTIQTQIAAAEDTYTNEAYDSIRAFDRKVRGARFMLANRLDHRRIFSALEGSVSRSVFYQSFESTINEAGDVALTLGGISPEFAQIVLQSSSLSTASLLTDIRLSRIEIKKGEGTEQTSFSATAIIPRAQLVRDGVSASAQTSAPETVPELPVATSSATTTARIETVAQ